MTARELEVLAAYARTGSYTLAGHDLGIAEPTVRQHLHSAYVQLEVGGAIEAFRALGWLRAPDLSQPAVVSVRGASGPLPADSPRRAA